MASIQGNEISADVVVLGAGLIGSSVAMHLARLGAGEVTVVDYDLDGVLSSSELNAGGVRATFNQPLNIECSKLSIQYFSEHAEDLGYRACGYLWMHGPEKLDAALKARERQLEHGWEVQAWDPQELKRRVPFIDKLDGIAGCTFAPRDGLVNPNLVKLHFRAEARRLGARFEDRLWIRGAEVGADRVTLHAERHPQRLDQERMAAQYSNPALSPKSPKGLDGGERQFVKLRAGRVVNCLGAWAPGFARMAGYHCPSFAVRRQVAIFDCKDVDLSPYGMMIDPSGVYFHPEATNGLAGFLNRDEPRGVNFAYDGESFFMEHIWPPLYERSTGFERLKHITGWAGQYEVSPDECAIIGQVTQGTPGTSGRVFEAHSFSGHGAMHSYAAGLALAELMVRGRYETLDLTPMSGARFESGRLLHETAVI